MNQNKSRRKGGKRQRARGKRAKKGGGEQGNLVSRVNPRFPNDVKMLPIHNRVFRFSCTGVQTASAITPTSLLKLLFAATNTSTSAIPLIGSVRLRRISLYNVPSTNDFGTGSSELIFQWGNVLNTPGNLITDRGTATVPACIKCMPPKDTRAGMWYSVGTTDVTANLFTFTCPANTVLDIDIDFILAWGTVTAITLHTGASTTGIGIYTLGTGHDIVPDGNLFTSWE